MKRRDTLLHLLDTTYDKENWYAPFKHAIEGLTAEQANWQPSGEATKTIWENVNHLIYYKERLTAKLEGREWTNNLDGDETFSLTDSNTSEWQEVVERAETAHLNLRRALTSVSDPKSGQDALEEKLLDILLHDAYHTGQIIQLRKLQGSWPAQR
ncbi:DinB family protein [Rossellomorea vietnamensis]|uniref:DinB family protein n=1 Tax=Rossellomorea vietnamensis TaxID=218284 RepID=A0A5D4MHC3_9BACI|nr:DinB family protein [Rossellomorea vietnamensis]TYS01230.1 DinB family protein [Rossellomorea vietnamensis]